MTLLRAGGQLKAGRPLTFKLSAIMACLVVVGLFLAGTSITVALRLKLTDEVDRQLEQTLATLSTAGPPGAIVGPSDYVLMLFTAGGEAIGTYASSTSRERSLPDLGDMSADAVRKRAGKPFTVHAAQGTGTWRVVAALERGAVGRTLALALPFDSVTATSHAMVALVIWTALTSAVLASVFGYIMVHRSLKGLKTVERSAAQIAAGDLSTRIPPAPPGTEVGHLTESLNAMLAQIEAAFAARSASEARMRSFVSDASHELRTPLAAIRGYAELYRMGGLEEGEALRGAMRRVEDEASRMGLLVSDLLTLARLDESRPMAREPVDLLVLAGDAMADAAALDPGRRVAVVPLEGGGAGGGGAGAAGAVGAGPSGGGKGTGGGGAADIAGGGGAVAAGEGGSGAGGAGAGPAGEGHGAADGGGVGAGGGEGGAVALGDEAALRRVVTNLVANAIQHTPAGSPVEIGVGTAPGGRAVLEVRDHGPGVPPDKRAKVFDRFFRLDDSRSRDSGGSGLGLAIVAGLVQAHGGSVELRDTPGGGSTFRIRLPQG
ncbi:MAG: HAMP domain-containing histidine kinase, partial [Bifidobacteriaceae bacterium]|nr:HAMP domain-containing histidine kinase [Bifidobacteriaceae bacterium]